ncbi:MAG: hypothetical protein Q9207_001904 [Kuettlingeria erythrocarpa]
MSPKNPERSDMVNWLVQHHAEKNCTEAHCVACALAGLSEAYWDHKPDPIEVERRLRRFEAEIATGHRKVAWKKTERGKQEDVQEFYNWLVNKLKKQLEADEETLLMISDVFELQLKRTSTCAYGHKENLATEVQNPLVLSCEPNIDQAIQGVFAEESMPDIECGPCKHRATKVYQKTIANAPDILCTHFNRFDVSGKKATKIQREVAFSGELDLSSYVDAKTPLRYRLLAAIHHEGNLKKGHYITYTKSPEGSWGRQNNQEVQKATIEEATQSNDEFTPYLLFWQKLPLTTSTQDSKSRKRSREAGPDLDPLGSNNARAKSPKTDKAAADSPGGKSSIWSLEWLYSNPHGEKKAAKELAECKKEHERKDAVIREQKAQIERAKVTNSELLKACHDLRHSLEAWKQATAKITPMMEHMKANGGKISNKASTYLRLKALAEDRESAGLSRLHENQEIAEMPQATDGEPSSAS